jgi:nucleotide-binding universal stress UspA family protein
MYDDVLVGVDGSDRAAAAFDRALDVATDHGARLHALYVADTTHDSVTVVSGELVDTLETEGKRALDELIDRAATATPIVEGVVQGNPVEAIVAYADDEEIDLVVLGESGKSGVERALLGSTTEGVVRTARTPTLTVSDDPAAAQSPFGTVLAATDGSDAADVAVEHAAGLAAVHDATLHVLSVVEPVGLDLGSVSEPPEELREETERLVERTAEAAKKAGAEAVVETVETGTAHRRIGEYVDEADVDLLVIGGHGRAGFERRLLGGTTEKLLRSAAVPVLTVRPPDDDAAGD